MDDGAPRAVLFAVDAVKAEGEPEGGLGGAVVEGDVDGGGQRGGHVRGFEGGEEVDDCAHGYKTF